MRTRRSLSRRRYLALLSTSSLGGLAGCGGQSEPPQGTTPSNGPGTATPTDTTTDTAGETKTPNRWEVDPLEQDKLVGAHHYSLDVIQVIAKPVIGT